MWFSLCSRVCRQHGNTLRCESDQRSGKAEERGGGCPRRSDSSPPPPPSSLLRRQHNGGSLRRRKNKTHGGGRGKDEQRKCQPMLCRTLISRGLDHSHWRLCLSAGTACGVEHSGGRCSHCCWLLCGQGGAPSEGMICVQQTFPSADGEPRSVLCCRNGSSRRKCWLSEVATCYVTEPKCLLNVFFKFSLCIWDAFTCTSADLQCITSWIFYHQSSRLTMADVFPRKCPDLGV